MDLCKTDMGKNMIYHLIFVGNIQKLSSCKNFACLMDRVYEQIQLVVLVLHL